MGQTLFCSRTLRLLWADSRKWRRLLWRTCETLGSQFAKLQMWYPREVSCDLIKLPHEGGCTGRVILVFINLPVRVCRLIGICFLRGTHGAWDALHFQEF